MIHNYDFKLYFPILFPTLFTSFPNKFRWTTAVESVGSVSACSVVETRVALTLVYVCNRIISKEVSKLGRPSIIKVKKSKILAS